MNIKHTPTNNVAFDTHQTIRLKKMATLHYHFPKMKRTLIKLDSLGKHDVYQRFHHLSPLAFLAWNEMGSGGPLGLQNRCEPKRLW